MSVTQGSDEATNKNKGNLKIFALSMVGLLAVIAFMSFVVYKKKTAVKSNVSEDEAQIAARGNRVAADTEKAASEVRQSQFGEGMRFDSQGNLLGSSSSSIPGLQNQTFESLNTNQPSNGNGRDIEAIGIDTENLNQYMSYQPKETGYRNNSDPESIRTHQEVAKQDRELARESSLVFCLSENITGRPVPQNQQGNSSQQSNASVQNNLVGDTDGYRDPQVLRMIAEANAIQSASMGGSRPDTDSGNSANSRFGALERPLVSKTGQLSDMRIGGLPEIVAPEGKFIDGVTVNQIETSFHDSPVTVLVTRDFIDRTGQYVLIPQGAKILGQAFRVVNQQQSRMFITFHRVIFPDGRSAYFPERQLPEGFNTAGLLGSDAKINNHWFRKFGSAIVMGVVQGLAAAQAGDVKVDPFGGTTMSGSQFAVQSVSKQFEEVTRRMMDYYSNLAPTITVKTGSRMKVYLSEDMLFSAYGRPR